MNNSIAQIGTFSAGEMSGRADVRSIGDLPAEKVDMATGPPNLKAAKAIAVAIPEALRERADRIME